MKHALTFIRSQWPYFFAAFVVSVLALWVAVAVSIIEAMT